jgi:hypothetical protein
MSIVRPLPGPGAFSGVRVRRLHLRLLTAYRFAVQGCYDMRRLSGEKARMDRVYHVTTYPYVAGKTTFPLPSSTGLL